MEPTTGLSRSFDKLTYLNGFGNYFQSEALPGSCPVGQNSPQKAPYNLYEEQVSGAAFTVARPINLHTWQYRMQPSAAHSPFVKCDASKFKHLKNDFLTKENTCITPQQTRWLPPPLPTEPHSITFIEGITTLLGSGDPTIKTGLGIHLYSCNKSMGAHSAFYNSDGDFLIVPQTGTLYITTEAGKLTVKPREICVIPRGTRFAVDITEGCRGWICEIYKGHFRLPELGPIGANGLANARDFEFPTAFFEEAKGPFHIYNKYIGELFVCEQDHSCFDVVGWHGNYLPFKYNLDNFNAMNTVTYDHPDPSIFTVLTCPSDEPGVAVCDFVIFPPRWMVGEHTFRPPYYHRNVMSEFMGNISGHYDAKEGGFPPGASSLHSIMTSHGPEGDVFDKASTAELKPQRYPYENLSFMFETTFMLKATTWGMDPKGLDNDYWKCWQTCKKHYEGKP